MHVMVTGGAGFLGERLIAALRDAGTITVRDHALRIDDITAFDRRSPCGRDVRWVAGDVRHPRRIRSLFEGAGDVTVFHLASAMSGDCQRDPDRAYATNVHGLWNLLSAARSYVGGHVTIVAASSVAAAAPPGLVAPTSTYGVTKRIAEQLLAHAGREGDLHGVSVRLPTVIVRPSANGATSAFLSQAAHDAAAGAPVTVPVDPEFPMLVTSPRCAVDSLLAAAGLHDLPAERVVGAPGLTTCAREIAEMSASQRSLGAPRLEPRADAFVDQVVRHWPPSWEASDTTSVLTAVAIDALPEILGRADLGS